MGAKDLVLRPVTAAQASEVVKRIHYSGKVVQNSQFHIGVFYGGKLEGAMQFGPSLDKRKTAGLVEGSGWHEFTELNRMAFSEKLPRNSESRALSVAFRLLKKHAPQLKWCVSFADAAQCGDGTIYRASGFLLTGIKASTTLWRGPAEAPKTLPPALRQAYHDFVIRHGNVFHQMTLQGGERQSKEQKALQMQCYQFTGGAVSSSVFVALGCSQIPGHQFRYVYFLDPSWRGRLTVPVIPFDQIPPECRMYRGVTRGGPNGTPDVQSGKGGENPTPPLHTTGGTNAHR